MAPDGRMFQTGGRKGELHDLRQGLNATTTKERKNALKRTVAAMTLGRDVSSLFTDVVKNTAGDISMKKLVYLYIINYAQSKPDLSILIVNTFIKDAKDHNPLIRALAIRTMALIPLEKITEYLCDPLHAALHDADPYVRKTAAVCVAKLYDTNPTLAVSEGFIDELRQLLADGNPMTVSNAVAALSEIAEASNNPNLLPLSAQTIPRFLSALSECTEWGQICILDAIGSYTPTTSDEADQMVERIVPRLQHANPAVVLAVVRVIVRLMPLLDSQEKRDFLVKKMSAPLISLLTTPPELQFVALRNFSLLITDYPHLFSNDVRAFFVSYADPLYVKTEKLNILVRLTDEANAEDVLAEMVEYSGEVDAQFAQKAVASISQIAVRLPQLSGQCVNVFSDILKRQMPHITGEVAIALKDVLRCYPRQFEEIVPQLCQYSELIEDPNAKSALVWIIGEHADRLPSAVSMLNVIVDGIHEETINVQQQVLTACLKAFVLCGPEAQAVTKRMITYATEESESIDLRDRGFIYQRLLEHGVETAQKVVLSNKVGIDHSQSRIPADLSKKLLDSLSSVASVYHQSPHLFQGVRKRMPITSEVDESMAEEDLLGLEPTVEEPGENFTHPAITDGSSSVSKPVGDSLLDDILGGSSDLRALPPPSQNKINTGRSLSLEGLLNPPNKSIHSSEANDMLLSAEEGNGLSIHGQLVARTTNSLFLLLKLHNVGQSPTCDFAIQLNTNCFALKLAAPMDNINIPPGKSASIEVPLHVDGEADEAKGFELQVAIKFSPGGIVYFAVDLLKHLSVFMDRKSGPMEKPSYLEAWRKVPDYAELSTTINVNSDMANALGRISETFASAGIFTVAKRAHVKPPVMYLSSRFIGPLNCVIMAELTLPLDRGTGVGKISSRSTLPAEMSKPALTRFNTICGELLR
ncbi:AP-2 complex subunit beta [Gracilariopsis chorda]|uniref:AP-2 complex subunit beta n=1 Tax=Gracilariopsis chorda TaxID=448386 RepID=A0A2V3IGE7_9FLOR|nr:AP-2 complex subunit beta [Gracilariopsis chorda]|eukprot:PXF41108.1 AP-2 complex subunit beta [Gracilariopsis chorda]